LNHGSGFGHLIGHMSRIVSVIVLLIFCGATQLAIAEDELLANWPPRNSSDVSTNLVISVSDSSKAERDIYTAIDRCGGYEQTLRRSDPVDPNAALTIYAQVPANQFDNIVRQVESMGRTISKYVPLRSMEQVDSIDSQLVALSDRMGTLRDAGEKNGFSYANELADIQSQIDNLNRLRANREKVVTYTTFSFTVSQSAPPEDPNWLAATAREASDFAYGLFRMVVMLFVWITFLSPFYMPFITGAWLIRRFQWDEKLLSVWHKSGRWTP
jgi:hypothetical protein